MTYPANEMICPKCGAATRPHCDEIVQGVPTTGSKACRWRKCVRTACQAVLDPEHRRGFLLRNGKTEMVVYP